MTVRPVNTIFVKCDRCGTEVEETPANTAGWIKLITTMHSGSGSGASASRRTDLCNPCTGIFNRMMEGAVPAARAVEKAS